MAITNVRVGESLVGDGNEIAHIDLILGPRGSAAETAFCSGLVNNKDGFTSLLAVVSPNVPAKPNTMMFNKVTMKGAKQAVQMFGPAQRAVARAVMEAVAEGTIPAAEADDLYICVGVFIHGRPRTTPRSSSTTTRPPRRPSSGPSPASRRSTRCWATRTPSIPSPPTFPDSTGGSPGPPGEPIPRNVPLTPFRVSRQIASARGRPVPIPGPALILPRDGALVRRRTGVGALAPLCSPGGSGNPLAPWDPRWPARSLSLRVSLRLMRGVRRAFRRMPARARPARATPPRPLRSGAASRQALDAKAGGRHRDTGRGSCASSARGPRPPGPQGASPRHRPLPLVERVDGDVQHRVDALQGACMERAQLPGWSAFAEQRAQPPERVFERHQQAVLVAHGVSRLDLVGAPPHGQGVEKAPDVVKEAA